MKTEEKKEKIRFYTHKINKTQIYMISYDTGSSFGCIFIPIDACKRKRFCLSFN